MWRPLIFAGFFLNGCVTVSRYTQQAETIDFEDNLRDQASQDLRCAPEKLSVDEVGRSAGPLRSVTASASGCGKRGVFVWTPMEGWVRAFSDAVANERKPLPPPAASNTPVAGRCTGAQVIQMHEAGLSESAIDSACKSP